MGVLAMMALIDAGIKTNNAILKSHRKERLPDVIDEDAGEEILPQKRPKKTITASTIEDNSVALLNIKIPDIIENKKRRVAKKDEEETKRWLLLQNNPPLKIRQ